MEGMGWANVIAWEGFDRRAFEERVSGVLNRSRPFHVVVHVEFASDQ